MKNLSYTRCTKLKVYRAKSQRHSEAPDGPSRRECQSPTESLSNFSYNGRMSPSDLVIPTPTDLDTTESIDDYEMIEEYLESELQTPTDLDTTESVVNITNESVTVLIATSNDTKTIAERNMDSVTTPVSEESEIDDSVADPDFEISHEIRNILNLDDSDRTKTLSDEDANDTGNQSPPVSDIEQYSNFDVSINEGCRTTSTPIFGNTQSPDTEANNDRVQEIQTTDDINLSQSILHDQHILTGRNDSPSMEAEDIDLPASEVNNQHIEPVILNNTTEVLHPLPRRAEQNQTYYSKSERRLAKQLEEKTRHINKLKSKHPISLNVCTNCPNNCNDKFTEADRRYIWNVYWNLNYTSRRKWLASCVKSKPIQRRRVRNTGDSYRKKETRIYVLPKDDKEEKVCLSFFLRTLGYTSDSVITELRKAYQKAPLLGQVKENRGRKKNTKKCNYSLIVAHINSFHPCAAHYRRYNAPNIRYMPIGVTLKYLYSDFESKHPKVCSRETYRKLLIDLGISVHAPESDVCADCAYYDKLKKDSQELGENIPQDEEVKYAQHSTKTKEATEEYNKDKHVEESRSLKIFSMDLEKVILLPNMPKVKEAFFVSRLVVFNETFAALKPSSQNFCCIWHEGIAGRDAPQIIDSLLKFIREQRDVENFIIWCDNCSSQNKNWFLFTAMVTFVNSYIASRSLESITFKYLTKGHTHMTADSIHGNIEQALKKKETYEYKDFVETVEGSRRNLKVLQVEQFHKWQKKKRQPRRQNDVLQELKLRDIVEVKFKRGSRKMLIKERFKNDYKEIDFLQKRFNEGVEPEKEITPRGIKKSKKDEIINKLVRLMPSNRAKFWADIPEKENLIDLVSEGQLMEEIEN